jgi:hypothetical protein
MHIDLGTKFSCCGTEVPLLNLDIYTELQMIHQTKDQLPYISAYVASWNVVNTH